MNLLSPFSFELPTRIEYGAGAVDKLIDELTFFEFRRILLVTDVRLASSGLLSLFTHRLAERQIEKEVFTKVESNPKDYNVQEGAQKAAFFKPECIVALGGGSPIDCAKAISVVATNGGAVRDFEGRGRIMKTPLPLIAIPTTAGSGSEVTFSAVITDTQKRFKFSLKNPKIAPRVAIVDPQMTRSMPPALTAATGMDALTHAIEAYTAGASEPLADATALHAIELINRYLKIAVFDGQNLEARAGMLMGSLLAAVAFSHSDVAAVHCLAEALGGKYDLPHGICNAVALPAIMEYNLDYCSEKYARIAQAMTIAHDGTLDGARKALAAVKQLAVDVQLPQFGSLDVKTADFADLARASARNSSNPANPRPMTAEDYIKVLKILNRSA